jgi:lipopolysaccharide export system protein LptA
MMNFSPSIKLRAGKHWKLFMAAALLASVVSAQTMDPDMEITGFRVPEYNKEGKMTSQLFGDRAEMDGLGEVKISGLRVEFYQDDETALTVTSPYCFYNRETREAHSDAPVAADMERVKMTGRGFLVKAGERTVHVQNDCQVNILDVTEQVATDETPRAEGSETVITSKEMFLDYGAHTVRFEKNVHVTDPQMELDSDELEVRFSESNEIDWIEATGSVRLVSEGREALAGKAVYDVHTDEFVLEDNPRLVDGRNTLYGERIRFWRKTRQMRCEPGARLVLYPDDELKTELFEK